MPQALLLFDGDCALCQSSVQFVLKRDPKGRIAFAALQSDYAQNLLASLGFGLEERQALNSLLFIEDGKAYSESSGALRLARRLAFPWPLCFYLGIIVPPFLRNAVYRFVARRRINWFGKAKDDIQCLLPRPEWKERFLDN